MADIPHQDRVPLGGAASGAATGYVTVNLERPPSVSSASSRETESLATLHSPSDTPDKLALSQPVVAVPIQVANNSTKSAETPTQPRLTDQTNLLPSRKIILVFAGLALCATISALDSVIIATAIPTISKSFNAGSISSWVPSAYMLTSTCFQPLYGRFSDIFGRKSMLCVAMVVYILGSLAAGFSTSIIQLIISRGFAGAGGGGIQNMAQIIICDIVSLRDRYFRCIFASFLIISPTTLSQRQISRNHLRSYRSWLCYRSPRRQ